MLAICFFHLSVSFPISPVLISVLNVRYFFGLVCILFYFFAKTSRLHNPNVCFFNTWNIIFSHTSTLNLWKVYLSYPKYVRDLGAALSNSANFMRACVSAVRCESWLTRIYCVLSRLFVIRLSPFMLLKTALITNKQTDNKHTVRHGERTGCLHNSTMTDWAIFPHNAQDESPLLETEKRQSTTDIKQKWLLALDPDITLPLIVL